ncbi:MAG TPA: cardiolipin synthase, partial [Lachnoclostridium sp.]|nr:cardiolipin synthase [Lachnoclostridium sp.]
METVFLQTVEIWNWLIDHLIYINLILSIIIVFFQRRDPKAVWTWLLALYFVPVFGILVYLLLGQDMRKGKLFRIKEVEDRVRYSAKNQEEFLKNHDISLVSSLSRDYEDLVVYNLETSGSVLTVDNTVEIFADGEEKFKDLRMELSNAAHFIHMQYYIIKDDEVFDSK